MANQFIARNGLVSKGTTIISGSLVTTQPVTFSGSLDVTGSGTFTGNVGIGTASPTTKLDVRGNVSISGSFSGVSGYPIEATNTEAGNPQFLTFKAPGNGSNDGMTIGQVTTVTGRPFVIQTTQADGWGNLTLQRYGGNVGIGTISPSAKLHVKGLGTTNSTTAFRVEDANASGSMVVRDDGFVGIGTTTPATTLDVVKRTVGFDYQIQAKNSRSGGGDVASISFSPSETTNTWGYVGVLRDAAESDKAKLIFGVSSGIGGANLSDEKMRISYNGNVGIGTTTPAYILDVSGSGNFTDGLTVTGSLTTSTFTASSAVINGDVTIHGTASVDVLITNYESSSIIYSSGSTKFGDTLDDTHQFTGSMYVTGSTAAFTGNVGIGTTSPSSILDASLSSGTTSGFRFKGYSDAGTPYLLSLGTQTYQDIFQIKSVNGLVTMGIVGAIGAAPDLVLQTNTTEQMRITSAGNVGIGITTPGAKLHVVGNIYNSSGGVFTNTLAGYSLNSIAIGDGATTFSFVALNNQSFAFTGGNVGIGTTSPTAKLHVVGNTKVEGSISVTNIVTNRVVKFNGSVLDDSLLYDNGTNVGIGTTSPSYKLDVAGDIIARDSYPTIYVDHGGTVMGGIRSDATTKLEFKTLTTAPLSFQVNSSEKMRIDNSGNVGIGTEAPTSRFQVRGSGTTSSTTAFRVENANASGSMVVRDDGYVGIGTTSPAVRLDYGASANQAFHLYTYGADYYGINMTQYDSGPYSTNIFSGNNGQIKFRTATGTTTQTTRMTITEAGNVGIGTTAPTAPLMFGKSTYGAPDSEDFFRIKFQDFGGVHNDVGIGQFASATLGLNVCAGGYIAFNEGTNGERVRIAAGGNVGIGTTTPSAKLHVKGSGTTDATTAFRVEDANATAAFIVRDDGRVGIGTNSPTYRVDVQGTNINSSSVRVQGAYDINPLANPPAIGGYTLSAGTNLGVGQYYYRVVYVTAIGETGTSGALSVVTTTGNTTVNLTDIPISSDPRVTARKLYRTALNQSYDGQKFLSTINDNTTTTYTDSTPDASLTGVSLQAYKVNTTSRYITVAGVQGMVIDSDLTALGRNAGNAIIASSGAALRTVLIGAQAGQNITTGQGNVIVGVAGGNLTTGGVNTLMGDLAGYNLTSGYENVILGSQAGRFLQTTSQNVIIGAAAARYLADGTTQFTSGANNVVIGENIRMATITDTNSIVIGQSAQGLGSNTTVIGNSSTTFTSFPAGNLAVGTTTDSGAKLHVKGSGTTHSTTAFLVENANASGSLVVRDSGNIGIGTTNPSAKLDVEGTSEFNGQVSIVSSALDMTDSYYLRWGGTVRIHGNSTPNILIFETAATERMRIAEGNVGIGTNTPLGRLHLTSPTGPTDTLYLQFDNGSNGGKWAINPFILNVSNGGLSFVDRLASTTPFVISSLGNVGIGTTTPTSRLQVKGSGTTSATTTFRVENANASGSMVVLDDGNVGIGTSTPAYKLDVNGSTRVGADTYGDVFVVKTPGTGWSFDYQYLKIGSSFKIGLDRLQLRVNNSTAYVYNDGDSGNSSLTLMGGYNGAATQFAPVIFGSGRNASLARETMRVDNQNQRVGIGTTTPSYTLDVSGSGNFTDNLTVTGSTQIYKSGSTVLDVQGSQGQLFSVVDELSGSLMSVNDISGLPILEVFSDDKVVMGTYGAPGLTVSGSSVKTGNVEITGSLIGQPINITPVTATASLDCSLGNFFDLTLSSSYELYLSASNIQPGQTMNLRITQPATSGSLTYGSEFKFPGGIPYEVSATGSVTDIVSFISFDSSTLYGTAIKNLS